MGPAEVRTVLRRYDNREERKKEGGSRVVTFHRCLLGLAGHALTTELPFRQCPFPQPSNNNNNGSSNNNE